MLWYHRLLPCDFFHKMPLRDVVRCANPRETRASLMVPPYPPTYFSLLDTYDAVERRIIYISICIFLLHVQMFCCSAYTST
jgi:hypothetical protein